jgi:phosphoadenosine phosphosulfate reductase
MNAVVQQFSSTVAAVNARAVDTKAYDEDATRQHALEHCNRKFAALKADQRIEWALEHLPGNHVLTSSFGAQAAVSLHLVTQVRPDLPVVLVDTGYLFPETYRFIDELTERMKLNLKVYSAERSPAWQEARHGQRWQQGLDGLKAYNDENKVEPMRRALRELDVGTWFAGLRRNQTESRAQIPFLDWAGGRWKVHPIAEWSDRDVHRYLTKHGLPYHPLWAKGYVSIGDHHSTKPIHEVATVEETRFNGLKRECGIHEINLADL